MSKDNTKIEYRAERRNRLRAMGLLSIKDKVNDNLFNSEFRPHTKLYGLSLAKHMLTYCSDFTHIKKITGLSIRKMLQLGLIEYYYPFKKTVQNPNANGLADATMLVEDTSVRWLRKKQERIQYV